MSEQRACLAPCVRNARDAQARRRLAQRVRNRRRNQFFAHPSRRRAWPPAFGVVYNTRQHEQDENSLTHRGPPRRSFSAARTQEHSKGGRRTMAEAKNELEREANALDDRGTDNATGL